jgi:ribosomal 50S subunit-recycling heat shock protein
MRLDIYLKLSRLIHRRNLAQEFCDAGLVRINNSLAKSSKDVREGDEIEIKKGNRLTRVRVTKIPGKKQVAKNEAADLYETIADLVSDDPALI